MEKYEWTRESTVDVLREFAESYTDGTIAAITGTPSRDSKDDHTVDILNYYADALEGNGDPVWQLTIDKDKVSDGMSLYAIDEDIEELMGIDDNSIESRNAKEAIIYEEGFSADDVTLDEDNYWDELLNRMDGMSASEQAAVWSNYLSYQERNTSKIKPDKRTKEYRDGITEEAMDEEVTAEDESSESNYDLGDKRVFDENAELSDEAYNRAWEAYEKRSVAGETKSTKNKFPLRKAEKKPADEKKSVSENKAAKPNYFVEMASTDEWWYAETIEEKLAMLKEVRDASAAEARAIAQMRLRDAGIQSVPKK